MINFDIESGSVVFEILKLNSKELETKMLMDEIDMVITYRKSE